MSVMKGMFGCSVVVMVVVMGTVGEGNGVV